MARRRVPLLQEAPRAPLSHPFQRVALWCWYRGADFAGYQAQGEQRTVQRELLRAFASAGFTRNPVVGGRTDKGVSARMQVLSARLERERDPLEFPARLNPFLPADLQVHLSRPAHPDFHAAWSASSKEYRYELPASRVGDRSRLEAAAALIPGTRNFQVFHFKSSQVQPRTIHSLELLPGPDQRLTLRFVGEGFARHMVRMLVGAISAVANAEASMDQLVAGLERQQNFHCPVAPPEPLTLWSIGYPPHLDPFTPEERADFTWPR